MKSNTSAIIRGVSIQKGDIVNIKFRKLEDILQDNAISVRASQVIEEYSINLHMKSFVTGGHFKVIEARPKETSSLVYFNRGRGKNDPSYLSEIVIEDHVADMTWVLNDALIESISVENDNAESYFSEKHQLSLVLVENILYINGQPLTKTDSKILEMFERVMADSAINNAIASENDFDDDEF